MTEPSHSFLVPAYGKSPYLRECLLSLTSQTRRSPILISTSTPFDGLESIARDFGARLHFHCPNQGIAHDWNEGMRHVESDWVTIAHQDDIYLPRFTEQVMSTLRHERNPSLAFTGYAEVLADGRARRGTPLLTIKKALLNLGFLGRQSIADRWSKLNTLRFGNAIPCPSVTLRTHPGQPHFETGLGLNMDWAAWIRKAQEPGSFVWIREELMHHRIHGQSETTDGIATGHRREEDFAILCRMWPRFMASLIVRSYHIAYQSNNTV